MNAFIVRDLDDDVPAVGIVRSAPKILQSGARDLARSQTYQCAVFNMRLQGASAGVNAAPDERAAAIELFCNEIKDQVASGALMIDAGKGVSNHDLSGLFAADHRSDAVTREIDGIANRDHLTGLGAVVCAEAAAALDGKSVAIEHFESSGPTIASAVAARGAKITAISTAGGTVSDPGGFDPVALAEAHAAHGAGCVEALADDVASQGQILGAEVDVLFVGSKMGAVSHIGAPSVSASLLVPTGPIPYTTKGALMLERQGTTVLPDFVTTAGPVFAGMPPNGDAQAEIESSMTNLLATLTGEIVGRDEIPIIEACHRAETFLATWRDELPFGRPFAA